MDFTVATYRVFLAVILGGIIGLEREFTQKSAGLRTHILVTLGATIFTWVSMSDFYYGLHMATPVVTNQDPSRVAAQIVAGIGFIGGGAVLRYGVTIRGLTTAASLWTMASIGMLVGIGQFQLAVTTTLVTFLVLFTIGKVERHYFSKAHRSFNRLRVNIQTRPAEAAAAQTWMEQHYHERIIETKFHMDSDSDRTDMNYILNTSSGRVDVNLITRNLSRLDGVVATTVKAYFENEELI